MMRMRPWSIPRHRASPVCTECGNWVDVTNTINGNEPAVGVGISVDLVMMLAAIGVGDQVLAAIFQPAHRALHLPGQPGEQDFLAAQQALVAEAAADIRRDNADAAVVDTEAQSEPGLHRMRKLRGGDHREQPHAGVVVCDHAASLHREHAMACGADRLADLDRCAFDAVVEGAIVAKLDEDVVAPFLVHERRVGLECGEHVGDGRQFLEVERHRGRDVFRLRAGVGDAHRDDLADVADLVGRKQVLGGSLEALERRRGDDRIDAGQILGGVNGAAVLRRNVDALETRMGDRAADKRDLAHSSDTEIADVLAFAA